LAPSFPSNMKSYQTEYGTLKVGDKKELFEEAVRLAKEQLASVDSERPSWALTGGSTPKAFYKWVIRNKMLNRFEAAAILWTTSDERNVDLESEESNFGNAARLMLDKLKVPEGQRMPWPTGSNAQKAAERYASDWRKKVSEDWVYDVCFVGMGDDCHTLSVFPQSELLEGKVDSPFAAVEVPGKGWRLTLTPLGLESCGLVVLMTLGRSKAAALKDVLEGEYDPYNRPVQSLKRVALRAVWLVDEDAANKLSLSAY